MNTVNLVIWILIYGICLVHITLFAIVYSRNKKNVELLYLIVLLNIFLLAVIIMLSLAFRYNNFIPIMVNGILTLYITIPLWGYNLFDVDKKYIKNIPILVITEAVIENILLAYNFFNILFISRIVFYILLTVPIFIKKENKYEKNSLEQKTQFVTKITVTLFAVFMASLIPFSSLIFEISYVSSLFWAVFTLSYQIPGLVYCKRCLFNPIIENDSASPQGAAANGIALNDTELSSLTKRENEVALAICEGLKYGEIAEKLFITLSAVKKHAYSIYKKLGIKNNRELMHIFMGTKKNNIDNESLP